MCLCVRERETGAGVRRLREEEEGKKEMPLVDVPWALSWSFVVSSHLFGLFRGFFICLFVCFMCMSVLPADIQVCRACGGQGGHQTPWDWS